MSDIEIGLLVGGLAVGGLVGWAVHAWSAKRTRTRELAVPGVNDPSQNIPLTDEDLDRLGGVLTSAHLATFRRSTLVAERPHWAEEKTADAAAKDDRPAGSRGDF